MKKAILQTGVDRDGVAVFAPGWHLDMTANHVVLGPRVKLWRNGIGVRLWRFAVSLVKNPR
jgi:hypothetical protein